MGIAGSSAAGSGIAGTGSGGSGGAGGLAGWPLVAGGCCGPNGSPSKCSPDRSQLLDCLAGSSATCPYTPQPPGTRIWVPRDYCPNGCVPAPDGGWGGFAGADNVSDRCQ
jgi:hypothetical protein